jgi:hypothetical protein
MGTATAGALAPAWLAADGPGLRPVTGAEVAGELPPQPARAKASATAITVPLMARHDVPHLLGLFIWFLRLTTGASC